MHSTCTYPKQQLTVEGQPYIKLYTMMTMISWGSFTLLLSSAVVLAGPDQYQPTWESLDTRPLPQWYDDAKVGIFIHWGVFSVPSFGVGEVPESALLWDYILREEPVALDYMKNNYRPGYAYADFAADFTTKFYDAEKWADIFKASGARYVVLVSKHVEGFTNWPSKMAPNWNAGDVGPRRDLVGELADAIRKNTDIHFGLYYSLMEWFNPYYLNDKASGFRTQSFVEGKSMPELIDLVETYKPDIVWSDGNKEASATYWDSTKFLTWLYNESPVKETVVTNDRWGNDTLCKHGGFYTCDNRFNPKTLQKYKFENCMTIDRDSWGFRRTAQVEDFLNIEELIQVMVETVSCGGNILMNIGPTHDGRIIPIYEERLRQMGEWLRVNGEAIYGTKPWIHQNDTVADGVWYTSKTLDTDGSCDMASSDNSESCSAKPTTQEESLTVYAIMLDWPDDTTITLGSATPTPHTTVSMLGNAALVFKWEPGVDGGMVITPPSLHPKSMPCQWAWVLKLTHLAA